MYKATLYKKNMWPWPWE